MTGVIWDASRNKYIAIIVVNRKVINMGRYKTIEEAIQVRKQAEIEHFGEFLRK